MGESLLHADGLWLNYGPVDAVRGVTLDVQENEIVALLGPNGCGKTTLLKALCGAMAPKTGTVTFRQSDVRLLSPLERARSISFVPQSEEHAFDFSLRELVLMGRFARSGGLYENDADQSAVERAMLEADCLQFADRRVSTLSGGEAQRGLIARALAQEAPVLLCDEPNSHLDPGHLVGAASLLRRLRSEGRAIVVTSHDLNWAFSFCDRAVFMREGEVVFQGAPSEAVEARAHETTFRTRFVEWETAGRTILVPLEELDQPRL